MYKRIAMVVLIILPLFIGKGSGKASNIQLYQGKYEAGKREFQWEGYSQYLESEFIVDHSLSNDELQTADEAQQFKITVDTDGIYRITSDDLIDAGLDTATANLGSLTLTSQGENVALYAKKDGNGSFEYLEFYGQKLHGEHLAAQYSSENTHWLTYSQQITTGLYIDWKPQFDANMVEYYSDDNVYWLSVGGIPEKPMLSISGDPTGSTAETPSYHWVKEHAEESNTFWSYHFTSTDPWFWEKAEEKREFVYSTTLTALATVPVSATVRGELVADSDNIYISPDHNVGLQLNASDVITATWDGRSRYPYEFEVPMSELMEGRNLMKINIGENGMPFEKIYFDWFEIEYARQFEAENDVIGFTAHEDGGRKYVIDGFLSSSIKIFDITLPYAPVRVGYPEISGSSGDYSATFSVTQTIGDEFIVVGEQGLLQPKNISLHQQIGLKSTLNGADYLVITHSNFEAAAQTLANYRASQGLRTMVVDIDEVFNEFLFGIKHPLAIKNFLSYTLENWEPPSPRYVILVGDGHWNPKGFSPEKYGTDEVFMLPNLSWVGNWLGLVDSTNLLATLTGDDPLPDLHISRIPVNTNDELAAVVDKIITYETVQPLQNWQERLLFIADDPDPAILPSFEFSSDWIIQNYIPAGVEVERIYLSDYCDGVTNSSTQCPAVTDAIENSLNVTGTLVMNYTGHGAINRWTHEQVWTNDNIPALDNGGKLPIVLSLTCLDGTWIWPDGPETRYGQGLIEEMLRADGKGVIGAFSPSGLGLATGHDALAEGFYDALYIDHTRELGELALAAKISLYETNQNLDLIQTFTIFGDPALRLSAQSPPIYLPLVVNSSE